MLSLRARPAEYAIVFIVGFYSVYLSHSLGLSGLPTLAEIGNATGPFCAWVVVAQGSASLTASLVSGVLLSPAPKL